MAGGQQGKQVALCGFVYVFMYGIVLYANFLADLIQQLFLRTIHIFY